MEPACVSPFVSGGCAVSEPFLSVAVSFLSASQWPRAPASSAGIAVSAFPCAPCDWSTPSAPHSFSSPLFFGLLKRASLQAPVAQPPSMPAQQGMEHECAADRTIIGMALDKSATVKSAAKMARKRGRVWLDATGKGELSLFHFETIETVDWSELCHIVLSEGKKKKARAGDGSVSTSGDPGLKENPAII
jgi:hypothetical protein